MCSCSNETSMAQIRSHISWNNQTHAEVKSKHPNPNCHNLLLFANLITSTSWRGWVWWKREWRSNRSSYVEGEWVSYAHSEPQSVMAGVWRIFFSFEKVWFEVFFFFFFWVERQFSFSGDKTQILHFINVEKINNLI